MYLICLSQLWWWWYVLLAHTNKLHKTKKNYFNYHIEPNFAIYLSSAVTSPDR